MRQILHVSDIHFGPPHMSEVAEGVLALARSRRPDLVVISGDLTIRAKPAQFQAARAFVDRLEAEAEVPTISVPGNHDVPLFRVWERLFAPYSAYRKHFSPELEPEHEDQEMLVVSINTAHGLTEKDGRVTRRRLAEVGARLRRSDPDKARIVVLHHELAPAPRFDGMRVMFGAAEAIDLFTACNVEMVLAGHLHQAFLARSDAYFPNGRPPILILHAGTTTSTRGRGSEVGRNSCNWITLDRDEVVWTHLGWRPETARFVPWSEQRFPRYHRRLEGLTTSALPAPRP